MAVNSVRKTIITYSGDVVAQHVIPPVSNTASPGSITLVDLSSGANTVTVPDGGSTPAAVTICPPNGNTVSITLKGITGDTGIRIHDTHPTTIALDDSVASFVLTAGASVAGVRMYWS